MTTSDDFLVGVVEGYYGRPWSFETRLAYAQYLRRAGLNACLYCPKSDPTLTTLSPRPPPPSLLDIFSFAQYYQLV